ncbi:MAG: hypothetical protein JJU35_12540 [Balneolales bacterium]|nr:hypothetical protein [Balneolales bacterium]
MLYIHKNQNLAGLRRESFRPQHASTHAITQKNKAGLPQISGRADGLFFGVNAVHIKGSRAGSALPILREAPCFWGCAADRNPEACRLNMNTAGPALSTGVTRMGPGGA